MIASMHRLAVAAVLIAGCLGEKTRRCKNGATCPYDEECTEVPIAEGAQLCGAPRLVEACASVDEFTSCDYTSPGAADGTCRSKVCQECQSVDVTGCTAPGWNRMTSNTSANLLDVWAVSRSEAYAVGEMRTALHYDGAAWTPLDLASSGLAPGAQLRGVWVPDASTLFVVANGGEVMQYAGGAWSKAFMAGGGINALAGAGAVGVAVGAGGRVLRFDGTWSEQVLTPPAPLNAVWVADANNAIAVGAQGIIFRYKDGAWSVDRPATTGDPPLRAVWGRSPDDVYAVGDRLTSMPLANVLHYSNGMWNRVTPTGVPVFTMFRGLWGTQARLVGVGERGAVVQLDGTTWTNRTITGEPGLEAVEGTGADNAFVVGALGTILRFTGVD